MITRNRLNDFSQPYATASLEDHAALQLAVSQRKNDKESVLLEFFGLTSAELAAETCELAYHDLPQVHRGISKCFPGWNQVAERGGLRRYDNWWPERIAFGHAGQGGEFISNGSLFFVAPENRRRVLCVYEHRTGDGFEATLIGPTSEHAELRREFLQLSRFVKKGRHFLQGKVIDGQGQPLENVQRASWKDIVLEPSVLELVQRSVLDCLKQRAAFRRNGIPLRRGLLLYGPPGNGKTMIGKALARAARTTFLYITAGDLCSPSRMRPIFDLARRLRPAILFFEDLDLYASHRAYAPGTLLGELLAQMDGLAENDGLVVMATTNDLAAIEPALKDRPSRFDVLIEIPTPSEALRVQLLGKYLARHCSAEMIAQAAERAVGASGAQLKEIAVFAIHHAIIAGRLNSRGLALPIWDDLDRAMERMLGKRGQKIGFGAGIQTQ